MIALSLTLGNHQRASHLSGVLGACGRDAYECTYTAVVYITGEVEVVSAHWLEIGSVNSVVTFYCNGKICV